MNLGKLNQSCPECGSKNKTLKRRLDAEHHAHGSTQALLCSECGYVYKTADDEKSV